MLTLIDNNKVAESNKYSFLDVTKGVIYTSFDYSVALTANYIAFQNPDYSNKWFFAFIDDVVYKGDKNTEIHFTVDAWSTWFDYWTAKTCFVSREHTNDDTIGKNTIPENIDVGNAICESELVTIDLSDIYVVIATNYIPTGQATEPAPRNNYSR